MLVWLNKVFLSPVTSSMCDLFSLEAHFFATWTNSKISSQWAYCNRSSEQWFSYGLLRFFRSYVNHTKFFIFAAFSAHLDKIPKDVFICIILMKANIPRQLNVWIMICFLPFQFCTITSVQMLRERSALQPDSTSLPMEPVMFIQGKLNCTKSLQIVKYTKHLWGWVNK